MPTPRVIMTLTLASLLGACASNNAPTRVGVISDYGRLAPQPQLGDPPPQAHVAPGLQRQPALQLQLDPAQIVGNSPRLQALSAEERLELLAHLNQGLKTLPSGQGRPVRVITALTDVDKPSRALNVVTTVLVGPLTSGGATLEISLRDRNSGEELAAMVCAAEARSMTSWNGFKSAYSALGHAQLAIDECLQRWQKLLQ